MDIFQSVIFTVHIFSALGVVFLVLMQEMVIEELTAIVGIKAQEGKREHFFDIFDLFQNAFFSFAPDGPLFRPSCGNIGKVNRIGKHS